MQAVCFKARHLVEVGGQEALVWIAHYEHPLNAREWPTGCARDVARLEQFVIHAQQISPPLNAALGRNAQPQPCVWGGGNTESEAFAIFLLHARARAAAAAPIEAPRTRLDD